MIGLNRSSLLFPRLVYIREATLIKLPQPEYGSNPPPTSPRLIKLSKKMSPAKEQLVRIYKLNWEWIEAEKFTRSHDAYRKRAPEPQAQPFVHPATIPPSYAARMDAIKFAIPDSYMKAINHCCQQAMLEWEHPYPFDTCIRDHCHLAAKAFIESAMHLLADCVYDETASYFNRDWETKVVFEQTALLRFWRYQMGTWAAFEAAGLKIMHPGSGPTMKNTMYEMPDGLEADSRIRIMEQDMLDFHNSLLSQQPVGPFVIEGRVCHLAKKAKK